MTSAFFQDADIISMMKDSPSSLTAGEVTAKVWLDSADELILQGGAKGVVGKDFVVTIQTSQFPNLKIGDTPTLDGTTYRVRDRAQIGDGALTKLHLGADR